MSELQRQFNSALYERLVLSRDKEKVQELSVEGQIIEKPKDLIKDPYILEFLGFDQLPHYSENQLETAIIDHIEKFIMELGKGFLFQGRQVKFSFEEEHFFVDLVFYNRILKCFVLIDLKIGKLKHQDIGQMQMYVNYYDRLVKMEDENKNYKNYGRIALWVIGAIVLIAGAWFLFSQPTTSRTNSERVESGFDNTDREQQEAKRDIDAIETGLADGQRSLDSIVRAARQAQHAHAAGRGARQAGRQGEGLVFRRAHSACTLTLVPLRSCSM